MMYWIEHHPGVIRRCGIYGHCNNADIRTVATGIEFPEGMTFDPEHNTLYWADTGKNKILRCLATECSKTEVLVSEDITHEPVRLAYNVQTAVLYWIEKTEHNIWSLNVDTSMKRSLPGVAASDMVMDTPGQMLYWVDPDGHSIQRCAVSRNMIVIDCVPEVVLSSIAAKSDGLDKIVSIAVDARRQRLFWGRRAEQGNGHTSKIESCPIASCEKDVQLVTEDLNYVRGLVMDSVDGMLYISDSEQAISLSKIRTCDVYRHSRYDVGCVNTHVLIQGTVGNKVSMPYGVALDWSEETISAESRLIPSSHTQSAPNPSMIKL
jgi:hypothetical protein